MGYFFGGFLPRAKHNRPASIAQPLLQQAQCSRLLAGLGDGQDFVVQVLAGNAAFQAGQLYAQQLLEMAANVLHHIGLGRGSKAEHGGRPLFLYLPDKARDVQVIRAKVTPPFG